MIVRMPQQHAPRCRRVVRAGCFGRRCVREHVVAANGFVATVQDVAVPFADEDAFGRTTLVASVVVDRSGTLRRPADDLDRTRCRIVDQSPVAIERGRRRRHDRHRNVLESCGKTRIEVVDHRSAVAAFSAR